jgi:hypothetical protein
MRRALGAGLALVIGARAGVGRADPLAPQLNPVHGQREDAVLLETQRASLDRQAPRPDAPDGSALAGAAPAGAPDGAPEAATTVVTDHRMVGAGAVLLSVAALSGLASLVVLPLDTPLAGDNQDTYQLLFKVLLTTTVISGTTGIVFLVTSRSKVRVAPAITPKSAGLSIFGEL